MDLLFISSLLLLLNILIISIFDLRYLINIDRKIKIPKYEDLKNKENLFVIFPVKNEEEDVLIKKIEYLKNINNVYKNLTVYFIFLDDTELDKEKRLVEYLERNCSKKYYDEKYLIYDLDKIKYFFRLNGIKRKGAALDDLIDYLERKYNIKYFSVYDLEWTVTVEYLYRAVCILESNKDLSFVYWNRRTVPVDYFHKIVGIYVDTFFEFYLPMKNILDDISMVHGSCGVLRLKDYKKAGKFTPHLTEDASLTIRLYLNGFKGIYIRDWVEYGQNLPPNFNMTLKTIRRWQMGTFDVIISNFWKILFNKNLKFKQKISFIHMFTALFLPLISLILILISIIIILFNLSSPSWYYIAPFFYFSQIYVISIFITEYYIVEKRIYNKASILDSFLTLLIGWSISALTISYYLRRLLIGLDNKWIVTIKTIRKYNFDYYSITVYAIFLLINIYFLYYAYSSWLQFINSNNILPFLVGITFGYLSIYIWIISILFVLYLQYRSYKMSKKNVKNLLYLGILEKK